MMDINHDNSLYSDDFEDEGSITRHKLDSRSVSGLQLGPEQDHVIQQPGDGRKGGDMVISRKPAKQETSPDAKKKQASRRVIKEKGKLAEVRLPMKKATFSPRDREISACNHSIKRLTSKVTEIMRELEESKKENKLLKRLQARLEKQLNNFQAMEGELPQMILRHREEARYLKARLDEMQEINQTLKMSLNASHRKVTVLSDRNKLLEEVAKRKHMLARENLTLQLHTARDQVKDREIQLKNLQRGCNFMEKNHATEYSALLKKNKSLSQEVAKLEEIYQRLHTTLREREKDFEVLNIYSQKFGRNFPRYYTLVLASHCTQTELSFSSSRDGIHISSSLANISTQTAATIQLSTTTQTDIILDPNSTEFELRIDRVKVEKALSQTMPQENRTEPLHQVVEETPTASQLQSRQPSPMFSPIAVDGHNMGTTLATTSKPSDQFPRKRSLLIDKQPNDQEEVRKKALLSMLNNMDNDIKPQHQPQPVLNSTPAVTSSTATSFDVQSSIKPHDAALQVVSSSVKAPLTQRFTNSIGRIQPGAMNTIFTSTQPAITTRNLAEDKKKSELLAKLMSIDDENTKREQVAVNGELRHSRKSNNGSYIWRAPVENMHSGRPAYAKNDPFDSRVTTSGMRRSTLVKAPQSLALSSNQFSKSNSDHDARTQKPTFEKISDSIKEENQMSTTHQTFGPSELQSSQTLFGIAKPSSDKNNQDYFWEKKVDIHANENGGGIFSDIMNQSTGFGTSQVEETVAKVFGIADNNGGSTKINSQNFQELTTIPEPDDLEELIL